MTEIRNDSPLYSHRRDRIVPWRRSLIDGCLKTLVTLATVISFPLAIAANETRLDDLARFLAGKVPARNSPLRPFTRDPNWRAAAARFDDAWFGLDRTETPHVRAWAAKHLSEGAGFLLYLFSGPDFVYANALFPDVGVYVLSGLEPVGEIPDVLGLPPAGLAHGLRCIRAPFAHFQNYGVFITGEMKAEEKDCEFKGALPYLLIALAHTSNSIRAIQLVRVERDGNLVAGVSERGVDSGVRIDFSDAKSRAHSLYYFTTDLSDAGVTTSGFLSFCSKLRLGASLLKGASYLLHQERFSKARSFLLEHSTTIVQDDTGIPLRYFEESQWALIPFGVYQVPVRPFQKYEQTKMHELYKSTPSEPINFGFGYRWRANEANLLLARKR